MLLQDDEMWLLKLLIPMIFRVNCKYVTFLSTFSCYLKKKSLFIYQEFTELEKPLRAKTKSNTEENCPQSTHQPAPLWQPEAPAL